MFSDFHLAIQLHEKVDWLGFYFPLLHSPQFSPIFLAPIFSSFYALFFFFARFSFGVILILWEIHFQHKRAH